MDLKPVDLKFASVDVDATPLYLLEADGLEAWLGQQSVPVKTWVKGAGFAAKPGEALAVPATDGSMLCALAGYGDVAARKRGRFALAAAAARLPEGNYKLVSTLEGPELEAEALGWLLGQYVFDRYAEAKAPAARLLAPEGMNAAKIEAIAKGEALTRDLINTPANDMGPVALEAAASELAQAHGAEFHVIRGEALLDENFPLIHTVGRASDQAPRLIDMRWGAAGPKLTLVGKGVCFDTGGLNLKPGASMALMKKDMGGAATVLGLAHMIMALELKVQLRVLIPAVENAVSSNAFRPGDILTSRKGLTVEINNTDAEGRLVLADALAFGAEGTPDLMISMATLTGAARVAVGPDLAPYFSDDEGFVSALETGAATAQDPVWRMPFWEAYETMIEPGIADLDNAPSGGFAGCITAALFLRRFAGDVNYAHFDIYGWNPAAKPARPKGGVGMAARALLEALPEVLEL
ncbi:leucyl aminopeptidase family protein [Lentibacter sp. XHP0401]|nr:leucyl aminopeptidase family protein [Lentibacter sp. XHP0401]MCV2894919.1 leucyl aminopeptidase family protein [Lentibacter sp. XHP0401]